MRKFLLLMAFIGVFSTCSSPNYTYTFYYYSIKDQSFVKRSGSHSYVGIDSMEVKGENISAVVQDGTLTASAANKSVIGTNEFHPALTSHKDIKKWNPATSNRKRELASVFKKSKLQRSVTTGDKSRNGAAVAGTAFSLAALIGILVSAPILMIFSIVGIVLSIIGLKSERKILSIIGLVMGVGFLVLAWIAFTNSLYDGSEIFHF